MPVFTVYDGEFKGNQTDEKTTYRQLRTDETMEALRNDLCAQKWDAVYKESDIDKAYNTFLSIFTSLFNKKNVLLNNIVGNIQ